MAATQQKPSPEDRVCIGAIAGVRGLKGAVRLKSFTADPDDLAAHGPVVTVGSERSFDIRVPARANRPTIPRPSRLGHPDAPHASQGNPPSDPPTNPPRIKFMGQKSGLAANLHSPSPTVKRRSSTSSNENWILFGANA